MRHLLGVLLLLWVNLPAVAAGRPMTVDDLLAVKGVADPQVSPDGKSVVYVVSELDRESGKTNSDLWLVLVSGGEPRRLTTAPGADNHPRWSPDGKTIAFASTRSGSAQIWLLPLDGGEARQLTKLPIDIAGPIWSPKGDKLAFAAEVYPGKTPAETAAKDKEKAESKSKARIFDHLMIRHWDRWDEGKRNHLFVCNGKTGEARDLTPKLEVNTPPAPFGGSNDYAFSPDGKELAFTVEPIKDEAWSTNSDVWTVPVDGGELKNLTESNKAADAQPAYSPDGSRIAYLRQARPGFESDLWDLRVRDRTEKKYWFSTGEEPVAIDRPVLSFTWVDDDRSRRRQGGHIFAIVDDHGKAPVREFAFGSGGLDLTFVANSVTTTGAATAVRSVPGFEKVVFARSDSGTPTELSVAALSGPDGRRKIDVRRLTQHNDPLLADLDMNAAESFTFAGADGDKVQGWLLRPPGFDPSKKYPVVFLIHGGPQGAWHDEWHGRWNYQMFAAPGYAVVAINPRGSTGFGQKFTDQISQDWTGRVYDDLMKGLDHALKSYSFLDGERVAAAGGSYGGFMVNWIAGHTDRFKCLISHAGVFDLTSKYGTTEELWFPEWEFGGTPWDNPQHYREQSPSAFVQNFKTPTLVIHGALDFRVPDAQGLGMFTALQRRGVASRYVFFPDEGHWIVKPANRVLWWREIHAWLGRYLKG